MRPPELFLANVCSLGQHASVVNDGEPLETLRPVRHRDGTQVAAGGFRPDPRRQMTQAVRLGIFSANIVAAWAEAHGVFADFGIAVEQIPVASSPDQFRSLMAGDYDAVLTSPDNVATYVLNQSNPLGRRLDLQILRAVDHGGRLSLVGRPGIERPADLAGGRFAVDVPTSGFAYVGFALLRRAGLEPERDYEVVTAGATPRRRLLLAEGEFDATLLNAGHEARAARAGAHVLGVVSDVVRPYLGTVMATRADGDSPAVSALLAAWDAAERAVVQPDRREDVLALLAAQPDTDRETAEQMYATLLDPVHGLCVGGDIDPAALEAVLRLRAEAGGFDEEHDLAALARPGGGLVRLR
jgi:ABC-type nitrate/sulfonate/bicarbonate transport system substrate-binding protein